jgi:hypothetical protein
MKYFFYFLLLSWSFCGCHLFGNADLEERLVQFSDEVRTVGESDKIQLRIMYKNQEGELKDSLVKFVGRDYFEWHPWLSMRFSQLKKGERYVWTLTENWPDPEVPLEWKVAYLDVEVMDTWQSKEWLSALTTMAQSKLYPEDSVIHWLGMNWIGNEPWDVKKPGLLWRWIRKNEVASLDTSQQIVTHISTHHLNGDLIREKIDLTAFIRTQGQWIPAIQWTIPYLHDGDSVEIVSKSDWTFDQPALLGIPSNTPLKFKVGVHSIAISQ